jgi:hypothetical protein
MGVIIAHGVVRLRRLPAAGAGRCGVKVIGHRTRSRHHGSEQDATEDFTACADPRPDPCTEFESDQ